MAKKFQVIAADCPWHYPGNWNKKSQGGMDYPTMSDDELAALPVEDMADDPSVLFLWGTWPRLKSCLKIMEAWGFRYVTGGFVWLKTYRTGDPVVGLGRYTKTSTEYVLFGSRGKEIKVADRTVNQFFKSERAGHSAKPELFYELVERLYPESDKLDLFSRATRPGWTCLGHDTGWNLTTNGAERMPARKNKENNLIKVESSGEGFVVSLEGGVQVFVSDMISLRALVGMQDTEKAAPALAPAPAPTASPPALPAPLDEARDGQRKKRKKAAQKPRLDHCLKKLEAEWSSVAEIVSALADMGWSADNAAERVSAYLDRKVAAGTDWLNSRAGTSGEKEYRLGGSS